MSCQQGQRGSRVAIETYPYDGQARPQTECAVWDLPHVGADGLPPGASATQSAATAHQPEDFERRLADESRRSFEAGRQRGMEDGSSAECALHAPAEQHRAEELRRLLDDVASGRDKYLEAVEHEVIRLTLAVAARILRREAQVDPLLLMGTVRVALGQLAAATEVRLRIPAADAELWNEAVALVPNLPVRPSIVADDTLRLGECRLETNLGEVDLGLRAQLGEMERGFFDRATTQPSREVEFSNRSELIP